MKRYVTLTIDMLPHNNHALLFSVGLSVGNIGKSHRTRIKCKHVFNLWANSFKDI